MKLFRHFAGMLAALLLSASASAAIIVQTVNFGETMPIQGIATLTFSDVPTLGGMYDPISASIVLSNGSTFVANNAPIDPYVSLAPVIGSGANASQWYVARFDQWSVMGAAAGFNLAPTNDIEFRYIMTSSTADQITRGILVRVSDQGITSQQYLPGIAPGFDRAAVPPSSVPAPGSLALIAFCGLGLAFRRSRR